jgi:hypothetical protein
MPAIEHLRRFQVGRETTPGTAVAATRLLRGNATLSEQRTTYRSEYPHGVRGTVGGVGVIVQRATTWDVETEASTEEILWPLLTGLRSVTPTGSGPYTWTFEPDVGSASPASIATMSVEYVDADGVANHYVAGAAHCVTQKIGLSVSPTEIARLKYSGFGRARQAITPANATPYASRTLIPGGLFRVWWDATWASLGTTLLTTTVRSAELEIETGWEPDYTLDARSDLDFSLLRPGPVKASLKLDMLLDSVSAARIANWRANSPAFVRLQGAVDASNSIQVDLSARLGDDLSLGSDGGAVTVSLSLEGVYDPTSEKLVVVTVKNGIAGGAL